MLWLDLATALIIFFVDEYSNMNLSIVDGTNSLSNAEAYLEPS